MELDTKTALTDRLGHAFDREELLDQALTHRSYAHERVQDETYHNERLEFLGDAVLNLCVGNLLMELLPGAREGQLTKLRAMVVSERSLARIARVLELGRFLRLGRGERRTRGADKPTILADALEAVIGAVFLDRGFASADQVVRSLVQATVTEAVEGFLDRDHKGRLQEHTQARSQDIPQYMVVSTSGPDHEKRFEVVVEVDGLEIGRGEGRSKKQAEQRAAMNALAHLRAGDDGGAA